MNIIEVLGVSPPKIAKGLFLLSHCDWEQVYFITNNVLRCSTELCESSCMYMFGKVALCDIFWVALNWTKQTNKLFPFMKKINKGNLS